MTKLTIRKSNPQDTSRFTIDERGILHVHSVYRISVIARDFVGMDGTPGTVGLYHDGECIALAALKVSSTRRDCRHAELSLAAPETVALFNRLRGGPSYDAASRSVKVNLIVSVGTDIVLSGPVNVELVPLTGTPPAPTLGEGTPITDSDGVFYMPAAKLDGVQHYRKVMDHEDEYGVTVQLSDVYYVLTPSGGFEETDVEVPA